MAQTSTTLYANKFAFISRESPSSVIPWTASNQVVKRTQDGGSYSEAFVGFNAFPASLKNKRLYIGIDIKLVFAILLLLFISLFKIGDPIARFLYPFFLVPAFTIKMNANVSSCKKMRLASIIMYMTQFVFIWLYGLLLSAQIDNSNNLFSYSITKFLIVTSLTLVVSYIIYKGEKTTYFNFFKYLH